MQRLKSLLQYSTSTLGGGLLIMLLTMLLGDKVPWFIERLSASITPSHSIYLDVDGIIDRKRKVQEIDPDKYYVDSHLNFYLTKPAKDSWRTETANPGHVLDSISIANVPFFKFGLGLYSSMLQRTEIPRDDVTTTSFSYGKPVEISFREDSSIGGYPLT